ncbi:MAG: UbiD family decarboxylase, partial [Methanomicrobiales archaeon]|nr:UbiD family decarboxylase [Methanomicrobiales archaeon]
MRNFIEKMRTAGLVVDIQQEVSPDMEAAKMAAGTDRLLFFHNLAGNRAVMNMTANRPSLALALGMEESGMVQALANAQYNGRLIEDGALSMQKPDLNKLPVMHHFPKDAGKYLTSAIVF